MEKLIAHSLFRYAEIGDEVGEEGTPHLQGYLELTDKILAKQMHARGAGIHGDVLNVHTEAF